MKNPRELVLAALSAALLAAPAAAQTAPVVVQAAPPAGVTVAAPVVAVVAAGTPVSSTIAPGPVQAPAQQPPLALGPVPFTGVVQVAGEVIVPQQPPPPVHSYWGYLYPGNSILVAGGNDLRTNMDGTVYAHPAFPGRNLFWNHNADRWCFQDNLSSTGWFFVPPGVYIPRPF